MGVLVGMKELGKWKVFKPCKLEHIFDKQIGVNHVKNWIRHKVKFTGKMTRQTYLDLLNRVQEEIK